jgi:hypothetical protein
MCSRVVFFAAIALAAAGAVRAQTSPLVDAQKRAEAASAAAKENKTFTPSFSNSSLSTNLGTATEAVYSELTMEGVRKWAHTVRDVTAAYGKDPELKKRMLDVVAWSRSIGPIERAFVREPALAAVLKANSLTPREYIVTQVSLLLALAATNDQRVFNSFAGIGYVIPNAQMLGANKAEVDSLIKDVDQVLAQTQQPQK